MRCQVRGNEGDAREGEEGEKGGRRGEEGGRKMEQQQQYGGLFSCGEEAASQQRAKAESANIIRGHAAAMPGGRGGGRRDEKRERAKERARASERERKKEGEGEREGERDCGSRAQARNGRVLTGREGRGMAVRWKSLNCYIATNS